MNKLPWKQLAWTEGIKIASVIMGSRNTQVFSTRFFKFYYPNEEFRYLLDGEVIYLPDYR